MYLRPEGKTVTLTKLFGHIGSRRAFLEAGTFAGIALSLRPQVLAQATEHLKLDSNRPGPSLGSRPLFESPVIRFADQHARLRFAGFFAM